MSPKIKKVLDNYIKEKAKEMQTEFVESYEAAKEISGKDVLINDVFILNLLFKVADLELRMYIQEHEGDFPKDLAKLLEEADDSV